MKRRGLLLLGVVALGCGGASPGTGVTPSATVVRPSSTATPPRTPAVIPTPTSTLGPDSGPVITFFGLVRPDGCQIGCFDRVCSCAAIPEPAVDQQGRRIFIAQGGGRGLLVVEGRPGRSGLPVASELLPGEPGERPDLQVMSNRPLGNGSPVVCDRGQAPPFGNGGGIPAVDPPDFGPAAEITDRLSDFACRFAVQPSREDACTLDRFGNFAFVAPYTTIQFCDQVSIVASFPPGETILTARLRDVAGYLGPPAQVIIRNNAGAQ